MKVTFSRVYIPTLSKFGSEISHDGSVIYESDDLKDYRKWLAEHPPEPQEFCTQCGHEL